MQMPVLAIEKKDGITITDLEPSSFTSWAGLGWRDSLCPEHKRVDLAPQEGRVVCGRVGTVWGGEKGGTIIRATIP